jgi:isoprenylcysteine carboxyl methyltransferase (ICMT) family protein YpbQ
MYTRVLLVVAVAVARTLEVKRARGQERKVIRKGGIAPVLAARKGTSDVG